MKAVFWHRLQLRTAVRSTYTGDFFFSTLVVASSWRAREALEREQDTVP